MPTHRIPPTLVVFVVLALAGAPRAHTQVLIDDFSSGSLAGWTHLTIGPDANTTGMTFSAASGAFSISSNGALPTTAMPQGGASVWVSSMAGGFYSHGTIRAKITLDTPTTTSVVALRVSGLPVADAIAFWASRPLGHIGIAQVSGGTTIFHNQVPISFPAAGPVMIQGSAVGTALSLKVWSIGSPEPLSPQVLATATAVIPGGIGVQVNTPFPGAGIPTSGALAGTFDDIVFTPAKPSLSMSQPVPGFALSVIAQNLVAGREYFTVISLDLCPAPGSGPYLGLCASNPQTLIDQLMLPVGVLPFHFIASGPTQSLGSYPLPVGLVFDVVILDASTFLFGGHAPVSRVTIN